MPNNRLDKINDKTFKFLRNQFSIPDKKDYG